MAKGEDTDGQSDAAADQPKTTAKGKSKRKELRIRSRRSPASPENNSNDEQIGDKQNKAKSPKSRTRNEAEKRNQIEKERKLRHDVHERDNYTNNRFLRAISGQKAIPEKEDIQEKKKRGDEDGDDDCDDADTTTSLLKKRETTAIVKSTEGIIVTPAAPYSGWFHRRPLSLPAAKRWTEQLMQQEEAGLFVEEERKQFERLEHSTLDRLEERLQRELFAAKKPSSTDPNVSFTGASRRGGLMEDLLLFEPPSSDAITDNVLTGDESAGNSISTQLKDSSNIDSCQGKRTINFAMLEIFVDRVVLDDHPTFALADRLAAQLRALYTAYVRMQQLQPWQLSLQRLDEFFSISTDKLADISKSKRARTDLSIRQGIQEVNQLLSNLEALSLLHQQIIGKSNELRDAGSRAGSVTSLRVKQRQRTQPIDLSRVEAALELLQVGTGNQEDDSTGQDIDSSHTFRKTSEWLATFVSTSAQVLQTVLQLESISGDNHVNEVSFWTPRFYVVLRVNGKIACTTKVRPWTRGDVRFSEKLCFTLPFFPSSVCAEVYERRRLLRDELISTNAVPVVIPGESVAKNASSRSRLLLLDSWGENDTHHLVPAASLTPSDEWYQFSSTTSIARSQWHRSFHNSPLFVHSSRRTQGRLHLRASWVSETAPSGSHHSTGDTVYLPSKRPETAGDRQVSSAVQLIGKSMKRDSTHLSQYLCDSGFSSERDFLRLVEPKELLLDPNDPENVAVRRLQIYYMQQQQEAKAVGLGRREVFRTSEISGPLAGSGRGLTKRNRLLRLRDREFVSRHGTSFCDAITRHDSDKVEPPRWIPQHAVFDEPLPLLEHELLADERLLRLLRPELHAFDRRLLSEEAERADASIVERHRVRQLLKLQDFRERVRQTQIVSNYNTDSSNQEVRAGHSKPLAAIVQENPLPLFPGTFEFPAIGALFAPRRRLRPRARVPAAVPSAQTAAHWPTACTLYVQVQKATNVPVRIKPPRNAAEAEEIAATGMRRRDTLQRTRKSPRVMTMPQGNQSDEAETPRGGLEYESHVFVQVSFQGKTRQTSCSAIMGTVGKGDHGGGAHPMWMETVALPFRPPQDDWSPQGIESTQDIIRFSIFDQVTRPASTSGADEDRQEGEERLGVQTRALHRENCFLGSLEVPFATLYHAGRLEASMRCEMPVEHLGYANLQIGSTNGAMSSIIKSSTGPPSAASSDGEGGSPRQRRKRATSRSGPTENRSSMSLKSPRSPEASDIEGDEDDDAEGLGVKQAAREATFLKLTLLLDPVLPVDNQTPDDDEKEARTSGIGNAQDKQFLAHAQRWTTSVRNSVPANAARRRNYNVFVHNLSHGATFLPRFLRAQPPPSELQSASLATLVRYVSLIPFLDDWLAFDGDKDVWSTAQEFLNMGAGDHEEHAVLLANYFMWYDRRHRKNVDHNRSRSYLVLGHSVPEGNIVFVLRCGVLWNASSGVGYAVSDPRCPLRDVFLVVSSNSSDLNWDIESNTKCWKPFFTARNITLPPSVQRRELIYGETPPEFVEQVERELREALKLAVRRWRSTHFATSFNEAAGLQLREHLIVLEREANGQHSTQASPAAPPANAAQMSPRSTNRLKQKLKMKLALPLRRVHPGSSVLRELQRSKEVCGLPLHVSFTDIPRVLEIVENTNIHYNERPGVEFALAVYVCGYPNCVLSVWVYLAALVPL